MAGKSLEDKVWQNGRILKNGFFAEYQIDGQFYDYVLSGRMSLNTVDIQISASEFVQTKTKA
ncbi:MAG TPA: hypothetical protein VKZ54_13615 [Membranihabitans sp.]|nr:hypothetical protein [Membranihabitans sp.]